MIASDGCEICKCDTVETCPDAQVKVKNYVDNIGACGEVCCEVKEDHYGESFFAEIDGIKYYSTGKKMDIMLLGQ